DVTFDVLDVPVSAPGSGKPTATVVDPAPNGGTVYLSQLDLQRYFDVIYAAPPGGTLDFGSILDNTSMVHLGGSGITHGILKVCTNPAEPCITPISAVTTDAGVTYLELLLDTTN